MTTIELLAKIRCLPIEARHAVYQQTVENIAEANGATPDEFDGFLKAAYQMNKPASVVSYGGTRGGGMSEALLLVPGTETEETLRIATDLVRQNGVGRAAAIQQRFQVGYIRAVHILAELERRKIVTHPELYSLDWPIVPTA